MSVLSTMCIQTDGTATHFRLSDHQGGKYIVHPLLNLLKKALCKKLKQLVQMDAFQGANIKDNMDNKMKQYITSSDK